MIDIAIEFRDLLLTMTGVTALTGTDRITAHEIPKGFQPGIDPPATIVVDDSGSAVNAESPIADVSLDLTLIGPSAYSVSALAIAVHNAVHGLVNVTAGGTRWLSVLVGNAPDSQLDPDTQWHYAHLLIAGFVQTNGG